MTKTNYAGFAHDAAAMRQGDAMHKTDVKQTSDLAGFAAREAGEVPRVNADLVDPIRRSLKAEIEECMADLGPGPSILGVCADDPDEPTPIRIDKDGIWRHAETREAVGRHSEGANRGYPGAYTYTNGDDWEWFDGKKVHRFRYLGMEAEEEDEVYHADPEEEAARAARPRTTHEQIESTCDDICDMLLAKNRKYGDSALSPVRIFSKATPVEQILVRLDDKLSRLRSAQSDEDEDVIDDLIGYLVLLKIARSR